MVVAGVDAVAVVAVVVHLAAYNAAVADVVVDAAVGVAAVGGAASGRVAGLVDRVEYVGYGVPSVRSEDLACDRRRRQRHQPLHCHGA